MQLYIHEKIAQLVIQEEANGLKQIRTFSPSDQKKKKKKKMASDFVDSVAGSEFTDKICASLISIHTHSDHFLKITFSLLNLFFTFLMKSMRLNFVHEGPVENLFPTFIAYMGCRNYLRDHVSSKELIQ